MLDIHVAPSLEALNPAAHTRRLSIGGALYWFLHRYFVHADLDPGGFSFLNLYEDTEISGYQLLRLKQELNHALADLAGHGERISVLTGWSDMSKSSMTETREEITTADAVAVVESLLILIQEALGLSFCLIALGD